MLLRNHPQGWMCGGLLLAVAALLSLPPLAMAQSLDPNTSVRYTECTPGMKSYFNYPVFYIPGVPYTATVRVTVEKKQPDGTTVRNVSRIFNARDSNGKARYEESGGCFRDKDGRTLELVEVTIGDPVAGTALQWRLGPNPQQKDAPLLHQPEAFAGSQVPPSMREWNFEYVQTVPGQPTRTIRGESIGSKVIHGIEVQGQRNTVTTPSVEQGSTQPTVVIHDWWISTTLGIVMAGTSDDSVRGHTDMEVENFTQGEPDPSMFQVPEGYTVKDQGPAHASTPSTTRASTPSTTQASNPAPTGPYPCTNVTRNIQDSRFAPGQRWSYKTRPEDGGSTLTIMEIDKVPELGVVIWVSVDHFYIPAFPMGPSERFASGGFTVTREALEASVIQLIDQPRLTFLPNYGYWIRDCVALTYRTPIADMLNTHELKQCQENAMRTKQNPNQCRVGL